MLAKRIVPCMDVKDGRVVKGVNFENFRDAGDPVELARYYNDQGADELSFLDITASADDRKIIIDLVKQVAKKIFIPFSVGGGINSVSVIRELLSAGAEKVSIGTAAVKNPSLVREASQLFGSQAVVVSIDAKRRVNGEGWTVFVKGGREDTGLDALSFAKKMEEMGAGEILLNSIDKDGTKSGYDLDLCRLFSQELSIPIIASGGAGTIEDVAEVFVEGEADAALAASIFHFKECTIANVKNELNRKGIEVRQVSYEVEK